MAVIILKASKRLELGREVTILVNIAATFAERAPLSTKNPIITFEVKRINSQSLEDAGYCFGTKSLGPIYSKKLKLFL